MARVVKVNLGPHFEEFVQSCIAGGRYNSVSEVVCAGLRLLEEDEVRYAVHEVPQEVAIGIEQLKSGDCLEVDIDSL
jgi:antitoxin ParD1/3/4